ncbi:MAG: hypothetical protein CMH27_00370 [Micavibrio sp.]|nr:hypothetical protein [Micavibrio sp.]|tara:strand:- start:1044 stop:1532 length:489 start_codon:yes stop_codon:yes gene_type:complete
MELLQDTNVWLIFSFLILCFIMVKYGKNAVTNMLDNRIDVIKTELQTAESLRVEAQELLAQYQRKQRDAEQEAETIIAKAEKHALEIRKLAEAQLAETLERREQQLKDRLAQMEHSAIQEIREHAANLAVQATAQIISEKMDKKATDRLMQDAVTAVAKNIH